MFKKFLKYFLLCTFLVLSFESNTYCLQDQKKVTAALLCIFLGGLGAHRFYVGKTGTGVLQLLSGGGLGIWSTADLIFILCNEFTNAQGQKLS